MAAFNIAELCNKVPSIFQGSPFTCVAAPCLQNYSDLFKQGALRHQQTPQTHVAIIIMLWRFAH